MEVMEREGVQLDVRIIEFGVAGIEADDSSYMLGTSRVEWIACGIER